MDLENYDSPYSGVVDYEFLMWMQAEAEYEQLEQGEYLHSSSSIHTVCGVLSQGYS